MNAPHPPADEKTIITRERLRLLAWGYYFSGGLGAVFASFLLIYVAMFGAMAFIPEGEWTPANSTKSTTTSSGPLAETPKKPSSDAPPAILFGMIAAVMGFFVVCGWILAGLTIYAGRCLQTRKHKVFIFVMGAINMIWIPYGTVLGILTILVMSHDAAKAEFGG